MRNQFGDIRNLIIVVLIIVILLLRQCSGGGEPTPSEPTIITKVETKYDTITIDKKVYIPKWKTKIVTQVDSILVNTPIDTLEVLKDYYAKNVFVDEIQLDSLGFVTITDTIWKNTLFNRQVSSDIIIPTKKNGTEKRSINNGRYVMSDAKTCITNKDKGRHSVGKLVAQPIARSGLHTDQLISPHPESVTKDEKVIE